MLSPQGFDSRQFARFASVGVLQNGLNLSIFAITVTIGVPYLLAYLLAAGVALTASFILNLRWTFSGSSTRTTTQAARYVSIWMAVLLLGIPTLAMLVSVANLPKVGAQAIVIAIGAPVSYLAQRRWTFSGGAM